MTGKKSLNTDLVKVQNDYTVNILIGVKILGHCMCFKNIFDVVYKVRQPSKTSR